MTLNISIVLFKCVLISRESKVCRVSSPDLGGGVNMTEIAGRVELT